MKQNFYFKFVFLSLLMMVMGVRAFADTSTLTFTAACGGSGTADDGAVWTVTSDGPESQYYETFGIHYGTSSAAVSYLQLATSDIRGTITKIVVNASGASKTTAKLNVTIDGKTFGNEQSLTNSTTAYTFEDSASGNIIIRLSQSSAKKALYVKSITVTYSTETPTGEKDPQNSFAVEEDNATVGVAYTMPTFTTSSDGEKSYSSSETDIATINSNGEITPLKFGTTTITVTTARTATFASGSASYTLHVAKGTPVLSFAQETVTAYLRTDQNGPKLTNPSDGAVTYEISDPSIATIQTNGYIHPIAAGTATVTATTAETEAWLSVTASYTLKVEQPFTVVAKGTYELVTDASTLKDGDQVLITYITSEQGGVLGDKKNNNFDETSLKAKGISEDRKSFEVTDESPVTAAILEGSTGAWYFHTNYGYLCATGSNKNNYLKTTQQINDNAKATISIEEKGNATVVFQGTNDNKYLRYNSNSGSTLFSCYGRTNNMKLIQIYRKTNKQPKPTVSFEKAVVEITYGDNYDKQQATVEEGYSGKLKYTSNNEEVVKFHGNNVIDVLGPGNVTITATAPATETTSASSASYTLKIYSPADAVEGLNETFDDCLGVRPSGDYWYGSTQEIVSLPSTSGWTVSNETNAAGKGCLKVGSAENGGNATSPESKEVLNGTTILSFDIAPWLSSADGSINNGIVTVTLTNATFSDGTNTASFNTNTLTPGKFNRKEYEIKGEEKKVKVNFAGSNTCFFLDNVVVGGGSHDISLKFSDAGYLTWVATADIDFAQTDGVTAYKITEATPKKITMVEVDKVAKGEAVMLKGSDTVQLKRTTGVEAFTDNKMRPCTDGSVTGNGVNGETQTDVYVLGNGKNGLGFYMLKGTLQAGKGYLQVSEGTGNAKPNFISFEETTGVKTVVINKDSDGEVYNLQGIRVAHPQKGIYVKNGKKYVIK